MGRSKNSGMENLVNLQNIYFLVALAIFLLVLATLFIVYLRRVRKASEGSWNDLLKRLTLLDRDNIAKIALDVIDESGLPRAEDAEFSLNPEEIWTLIGGLEGIEVLERNCAVLVDMAFYVQKWYPEAVVVAEQLRLNAREIEWHVARLKGAAQTGNLESAFAGYAQRAVATYYLMTRHVLSLYEQGSMPEFADLQQAL
jgi:hypothetical protein